MVLAVDQEDSATGEIETVKIDLEQILNLFAVIGNEPPTGVAHIWTTDAIPTGYLELNGQTFDPNTYPQLGLTFPSGILPDWRGRVPKYAPTGRNAGETEEDNLKAHSHTITVNYMDLGQKATNQGGEHTHVMSAIATTPFPHGAPSYASPRAWTGAAGISTQGSGTHNHTINMGSHNHTASCSTTGATENTVKGVFVRYIVRAR